jgi:predicted nucleotidyltransferase component of viral defense system
MKKPLSNVAESVRARLLNLRTNPGEDYHELLVRFCLERLLYRLSISAYRERFVLKGAMLFALWQGFLHRRTRDLDLLGFGDPAPESVAAVFKEIVTQSVPVDDGILFEAATVEASTIKSQDEYVGARVKLCAFIGKARIWLQVDVGYGDSITPEPLERAYPGLLDFPQAMLRCYAPETALAEKFEAVVNLGLVNSRMKDYFDFWTIGHQFAFDGTIMADTIRNTFARRSTPVPSSPPIGLSEVFWSDTGKQTAWRAFWKKSVAQNPMLDLETVGSFAASFLLPPARAAAQGEHFTAAWKPGGPWEGGSA